MSAILRPDSQQAVPATADRQAAPLALFTAEQVRCLTGLSAHQLRYWDNTGFFSSSYQEGERRKPYGRVYLYRDVVGLRTVAILRNEHHIPLQKLREVGRWLKEHEADPWPSLRVFVAGRHVYFEDRQTHVRFAPGVPGQVLLPIELGEIENETWAAALRLRERAPEQIGKITRHRDVLSNAWVLDGTRVPTAAVWNFHRAGHDMETILAAYPRLTPIDVQKAIEFEQRRHPQQAG